jgi:CrcB protein
LGPSRRSERGGTGAPPDILATIAIGGALGAIARYEVAELLPVAPGAFPWATFWTNVSGSFALGFLLILCIELLPRNRYLRPFLATGFLGAYTTFSTFSVEVDLLVKDGHAATGVAYALGSLSTGFAAVWAGMLLARKVPVKVARPRRRPPA